MVHVYQEYYSWSQKGFGMMHRCYCPEVLMCGKALLLRTLPAVLVNICLRPLQLTL